MRILLWLLIIFMGIQVVAAQSDSTETNPLITVDNVYLLEPLQSISRHQRDIGMEFSRFESADTNLLLTNGDAEDTNSPFYMVIDTWDFVSETVTNSIRFESRTYGYVWQFPHQSKLLVLSIGGGIYVLDYPSGNIEQTLITSSSYLSSLAVSRDKSTFVYTDCEFVVGMGGSCEPASWFLRVYDINTLEEIKTILLPDFDVRELAMSPNGQQVLVRSSGRELRIWNTQTAEQIELFEERHCQIHQPLSRGTMFFLSETTILVTEEICPEHQVRLWDFATDEERIVFTTTKPIRHIALSADNAILGVFTAGNGEAAQLSLLNFQTGEILSRIDGGYPFDFSPDGRYLIAGDIIYGIQQ